MKNKMEDVIGSFSVLLVFLSLLFIHIDNEINKFSKRERPHEKQRKDLLRFKKQRNYLLTKAILSILFIGSIWYITAPEAIEILRSSKVNLYDFNELETIYVALSICILGLTIILTIRTIKLSTK